MRRNDIAPYITPVGFAGVMPEAQGTARLSGAAGTAAASDGFASWDGNPLPRRGRAETALLALCGA
ncbi:TPA: hypothetical protein ACKFMW_004514 [Enterobacter hormaechei]